jgi:MraZ protein
VPLHWRLERPEAPFEALVRAQQGANRVERMPGAEARMERETPQRWLTVEGCGVRWSEVGDRVDLTSSRGRRRMFFGTYTPKLDEKGRLFLPAKFRDQLTEGLVVTRGQERCLTVWSLEDFGRLTDRLREAPVTNKGTRDYVRMLFAAASQEVPDKQGRISIPGSLREYASLTKDVVVIGSMNRIEIWDPTAWTTYSEEQEQKFSELSDEVFPGI